MMARALRSWSLAVVAGLAVAGCSRASSDGAGAAAAAGEQRQARTAGEPVTPPFDVKGDARGLLLVWFDTEGLHAAQKRDDIPEAHRQHVRVDSLSLAPDKRLDPAYVYVADLRSPRAGGAYAVSKLSRDAFEALVDRASGAASRPQPSAQLGTQPGAPAAADVVIYGAAWCQACRAAAAYFRQRGVAFVEKDIERDSQALAELQSKARAAGVTPSGIPVIDFRGHILQGFDQPALDALTGRSGGGGAI